MPTTYLQMVQKKKGICIYIWNIYSYGHFIEHLGKCEQLFMFYFSKVSEFEQFYKKNAEEKIYH